MTISLSASSVEDNETSKGENASAASRQASTPMSIALIAPGWATKNKMAAMEAGTLTLTLMHTWSPASRLGI